MSRRITRSKYVVLALTGLFLMVAFSAATQHVAAKSTPVTVEIQRLAFGPFDDVDANKILDFDQQLFRATPSHMKVDGILRVDSIVTPEIVKKVESFGVKVTATWDVVLRDGMAITGSKAAIMRLLEQPFVTGFQLDRQVSLKLDTARYYTGVDDLQSQGYDGSGVVICVIDTGIDAGHVDLDGGKVIGFKDYVNGRTSPYDDNGHGTHVSSIATGSGDGNYNYRGVAPAAKLVGVKVLSSSGSGSTTNVINGINWCAGTGKSSYGVDIISMSLGSSYNGYDSTAQAADDAVAAGLTVVVAAGNSGPGSNTVGSPGTAYNVITVGAVSDPGEGGWAIASFSSRGPTADGRIKPDVVAPGVNIMAAKANSGNGYVSYSGTSMATPFVSGTVALYLQAKGLTNGHTPSQVKNDIEATAIDMGPAGKDNTYGSGRIDPVAFVTGNTPPPNPNPRQDQTASESLPGSGYYDWWKITAQGDGYDLTIEVTNFGSGSNPDFDLYVYAGSKTGTEVGRSESTGPTETVTVAGPSAGAVYYAKVSSYSGSGSYTINAYGATGLTLTDDDLGGGGGGGGGGGSFGSLLLALPVAAAASLELLRRRKHEE